MLNWLKYFIYSGCNITIKLNPFHWRLGFNIYKYDDAWETDALVIELLPITIRVWFDDGSW
jgi:hypothetical protein